VAKMRWRAAERSRGLDVAARGCNSGCPQLLVRRGSRGFSAKQQRSLNGYIKRCNPRLRSILRFSVATCVPRTPEQHAEHHRGAESCASGCA
jgi:hypothetical protein